MNGCGPATYMNDWAFTMPKYREKGVMGCYAAPSLLIAKMMVVIMKTTVATPRPYV